MPVKRIGFHDKKGVIEIRKDSTEYKIWLKHRNEKRLLLRTRKKLYKKAKARKENEYNRALKRRENYNPKTDRIEFTAPNCFSVIKNPEQTISFFNDIIHFILNNRNYKKQLFIDISKITELTVDALMYLLAIVNNLKAKFNRKYSFFGNAPQQDEVRKKFTESGFYKYVNYQGKEALTTNRDNLQIVSGNCSQTNLAKRISDFVAEKANVPVRKCSFLYNMMIELMSNVHKHAYNKSMMLPHWYCYAEYIGDDIVFTFMDTGEGVPSTVRKRFSEKIDFLGIKGENKYVISALNGEFRTSTNKKKHGKGMPKIREFCSMKKIHDMRIITSKADVSVEESDYTSSEMKVNLLGTLYCWKVNISTLKGENI